MKDMIQRMTDIEVNKQQLNESEIAEMPPMGAAPAMDQGNPVTVNVSMNASGKEHVADLLDMMKNAGLGGAEPVSAKTLSPRLDMERLAGIMDDPKIPGKDEVPGDEDTTDSSCMDDVDVEDTDIEEWENSPDGSEGEPEYKDHHYMTKDLSGGINRKKKQFKAAQPGDNAMAMEGIKEHLYNLLAEKKGKPDFLDLDKDGDKKEPMKKAAKDAKGGKKSGKKEMSDKQKKFFGKKKESVEEAAEVITAEKMPKKKDILMMCSKGMKVNEICKKYPNCDQKKLKEMCEACMSEVKAKKTNESVNESVEVIKDPSNMSFVEMLKLVKESGGQQQIDPVDETLWNWAQRVATSKVEESNKAEIFAGLIYERNGGRFEMYDVMDEDGLTESKKKD